MSDTPLGRFCWYELLTTDPDAAPDFYGQIAGWTVKETWEFEIQNSKAIGIMLDIRRNFQGDWEIATDAEYEKVDANKVKFVRPLEPGEKQTFQYVLTTRFGTNVRK